MIEWPKPLIEELAGKRALVFLGAGVSQSAENSAGLEIPGWRKLLEMARDRFCVGTKAPDKSQADELLGKMLLLDAAEIIFHAVDQADKRRFFSEIFASPDHRPSKLHKHIKELNAKVVVTTNYDQLYEEECGALRAGRGYAVRDYTYRSLLNDIRSKDNIIIKAHGCVNATEGIILTRSDYFTIKRDYASFYSTLDALLLVNTVFFVGCSLTDPDITLILENTNIAAFSDHKHYAVMPSGAHGALRHAIERGYNIKVLEYRSADNHKELLDSMESLVSLVHDEVL
jgi:hypothetical protein